MRLISFDHQNAKVLQPSVILEDFWGHRMQTRSFYPGTFLSQIGSSTQSLQKPTGNKDLMFLKMGQRPDVGLIPGPSSPFPQQQEFVADGCSFQEFLDEEFSDAKQKRRSERTKTSERPSARTGIKPTPSQSR